MSMGNPGPPHCPRPALLPPSCHRSPRHCPPPEPLPAPQPTQEPSAGPAPSAAGGVAIAETAGQRSWGLHQHRGRTPPARAHQRDPPLGTGWGLKPAPPHTQRGRTRLLLPGSPANVGVQPLPGWEGAPRARIVPVTAERNQSPDTLHPPPLGSPFPAGMRLRWDPAPVPAQHRAFVSQTPQHFLGCF